MITRHAFDQPIVNTGSVAIPAAGVVKVVAPGLLKLADKEWLTVGRPDGSAGLHLINGTFPLVGNGSTGMGAFASRTLAPHALCLDVEDGQPKTPATNEIWGVVKDQFYLKKGEGVPGGRFVIVGDLIGDAASLPGELMVASTRRVRVATIDGSQTDNIIAGKVASTNIDANNEFFFIDQIIVIEGPDPRQNPSSTTEQIRVENVPASAREFGAPIRAKKNQANGKWFPELGAASTRVVRGNLITDLRVNMSEVPLLVAHTTDPIAAPLGAAVIAQNPIDQSASGLRYQFGGKAGGNATATQFDGGAWVLDDVQPPHAMPA